MPDYTPNLLRIMREATDFSVVCEIYAADAVPGVSGFNPNQAIKRYAATADMDEFTGGIGFFGASYTRLIKKFGSIRRTITAEVNSAAVDFDNLTKEISAFEFGTAFEGLIKVIRLISRSQSLLLSDSKILFVGRCEKPKTGDRLSLAVTAKHILGEADAELPRRKFTPDDAEGRSPSDVLFEGFRFVVQYGAATYSVREKRGGFFGFLGFKKTVTKTVPWSSFSDLDAEKYLPEIFGRMQAIGTHLGYADVGNNIQMLTAFCEGEIEDFVNARSVTPGFSLNSGAYFEVRGELGGVGDQQPDPNWIAPGYYSRTALIRCDAFGTSVQTTDAAPDVVAVVLGKKILTPNAAGAWNVNQWSDDAAAQTRFLLTSADYYKLNSAWIDDAAAFETFKFNNEIIFDASYSDTLFVPGSDNFTAGDKPGLAAMFASTGLVTPDYFKLLEGAATATETFIVNPKTKTYTAESDNAFAPIEPGDGDGDGDGEEPGANLFFYLRRRYTSNVIVTEQIKLIDFLHQVIFPSSRMFLTQGANGKIKLNNKKPVDFALGTAAFAGNSVAVDDVQKWIADKSGQLLIDPNTKESEVRTVTAANYSAAQNSVALSASGNITVAGFSGGDGANNPAQATLTVNARADENKISLDGIEINFIASEVDTLATTAGFIYGTINGHPTLRRKFAAAWIPGAAVVTIKAKFGTLTLNSNLEFAHSAPFNQPPTAPILTAAGGTLKAGTYKVAYSYANARGQTLLSPFAEITLAANQKITVSAIVPPTGADVSWYVSPSENSRKLRFYLRNTGAAFSVTELPRLSAALTPDFNRTGCEVLRVAQVFSDRAETRSNIAGANVLKATYKWLLGNREKSVNRIDLKYRDATQDFRLIELRLRDDEHIAKTHKISNLVVNGQAIDSHHQAYRIAAGMLAELRDADFFYEWTSDREAMLLEEGQVVTITDDGAQIYNLAVRIESITYTIEKGFPKASFIARKYSTTLYDDSVAERQIPVIVETGNQAFVESLNVNYAPTNFTPTRSLDRNTASLGDVIDVVATIMDDLENNRR